MLKHRMRAAQPRIPTNLPPASGLKCELDLFTRPRRRFRPAAGVREAPLRANIWFVFIYDLWPNESSLLTKQTPGGLGSLA